MRRRRGVHRRQLLRDGRTTVAESEPVRHALLRRHVAVPALTRGAAPLLVATLAGATLLVASAARADIAPDLDDPQVRDAIARVLEHIRYQSGGRPLWGTIEVDGADDLVIVVEPIDAHQRESLGRVAAFERPEVLWWDESRPTRLARVRPRGRLALHNPVPAPQTFELFRGKRLWARVIAEAHADVELRDLPDGIVRVRRVGSTVDGWIYVTPWPSRVLHADRRETFNVPFGRYRLRGWNPRGGERSVVVTAN
jgi:hypothetical protein